MLDIRKRLFAWANAHHSARIEQPMAPYRARLLADVHGEVLEIGPGAGKNFAFFNDDVRLTAIEPNPHMHPYFRVAAVRHRFNASLLLASAPPLEFDDHAFDAVLCFHVLCSVADVAQTLREIRRVLRRGGAMCVIEHVAAPRGTWHRRTQNGVQPLWSFLADGCRPNRDTEAAIRAAGFAAVDLERVSLPYPIAGPHIVGVARV